MANLIFPSSPSANDVYTNPITGLVYIYDGVYGHWKTASNNILRGTSNDKNLIYDDNNEANGSNNLIFDRSSNTILANVISVYNISASVLIANGININLIVANSYDKANDANILAFNTGPAVNLYAAGVGTNVNVRTTAIGNGSNVLGNLAFIRANQSFNTIVVNDTVPGTRLVEGSVFPYPNFNLTSSNGVTLSAYSPNNTINIGLSLTGVTPTTYGSSEIVNPLIIVDAYGRVTTASNVAVSNALLVGISANTYANGVGANANVYAGIMANSVNLYIASVGVATNAFADFAYDRANDSYNAANSINAQTATVRNAANAANDKLASSSGLAFANANVGGTLLTSANSSDTLSFVGANGITFTAITSPKTINVGLSATGVTPGTYGSSTLSPWVQIDNYGRITNAGTNTPVVPKYQFRGGGTPNGANLELPPGKMWLLYVRDMQGSTTGGWTWRFGTGGVGGGLLSTNFYSYGRWMGQVQGTIGEFYTPGGTGSAGGAGPSVGFMITPNSFSGRLYGIGIVTRIADTNVYMYEGRYTNADGINSDHFYVVGRAILSGTLNAVNLDASTGAAGESGAWSVYAFN